MSLEAIANDLIEMDEKIILIYAFNGVGKTQLSIAYKNATKAANGGKHAGVYYNALSEDLFVWDNDEANDGANIKLDVLHSPLNQFHSFIFEDENYEGMRKKLAPYNPKYDFRFNTFDDTEQGIDSITFFLEGKEHEPVKISRGEERIFVWCFYLAMLEVEGWADEQNAHIFIDDPVSSLDEHNIFVTAETLMEQIDNHYRSDKRIIITTHHIGLFSILATRLEKGEKADRYKQITGIRILKQADSGPILDTPRRNVFLYHLHLLQVLDEAKSVQLFTYHFALLRQLLENIASFLGTGRAGHTLREIGVDNVEETMTVINTHSHKSVYYDQSEMMSPSEENVFKDIFNKLVDKYKFQFYASN